MMQNRKLLRLLAVSLSFLNNPSDALKLSMAHRGNPTNRPQSHTTTMRGRLGHLRPRLWGAAVAIESTSPTSLGAAMKFKNFEEMLLTFGNSLLVVAFSTDLCGPCRLMKKELSRVSAEIGDDVKVFLVNTDKFPKLGARYNISVLPTLVIFKEGQIQDRIEGMETADSVVERLRTLL
jgi:thiol-disulfide isomerase/thioredoxin